MLNVESVYWSVLIVYKAVCLMHSVAPSLGFYPEGKWTILCMCQLRLWHRLHLLGKKCWCKGLNTALANHGFETVVLGSETKAKVEGRGVKHMAGSRPTGLGSNSTGGDFFLFFLHSLRCNQQRKRFKVGGILKWLYWGFYGFGSARDFPLCGPWTHMNLTAPVSKTCESRGRRRRRRGGKR